jgi:hypothetical protein
MAAVIERVVAIEEGGECRHLFLDYDECLVDDEVYRNTLDQRLAQVMAVPWLAWSGYQLHVPTYET